MNRKNKDVNIYNYITNSSFNMKKLNIVAPIICLLLFFFADDSYAQGKSNKKIKTSYKKETGTPPWAPAHGYRAKTRYVFPGS